MKIIVNGFVSVEDEKYSSSGFKTGRRWSVSVAVQAADCFEAEKKALMEFKALFPGRVDSSEVMGFEILDQIKDV